MEDFQKLRTMRVVYFITGLTIILILANVALGFVLFVQSRASMKSLIDSRMLDIAKTAADMLDGNDLKSLKAEDKGTAKYQKINDTLAYFQNNIDLNYIYCIQDLGNKKFAFSVDPTLEDPGEFGSPIVYTEALYKASLGMPAADEEPYSDDWGRFYSAYCPVFDSSRNVAGIVAVDFSADWYDEEIAKQTRAIVVCVGVSLVMCVFLGYFVATRTQQLEAALQSVEKMRVARDDYKIEAETDKLTGLFNKVTTEQLIREALKNRPLDKLSALYILDLDHFKEVNDTYGHSFGDEVLKGFAACLRHEFRADDIIGRFGGDEFFVLISGMTDRKIVDRRAEKIIERVLEMRVAGRNAGVSVSIGITLVSRSGMTYEEVFKNADNALYKVKSQGRNGYSIDAGEVIHGRERVAPETSA